MDSVPSVPGSRPKTRHGLRVSTLGPDVNSAVRAPMRSRAGPRIGRLLNECQTSTCRRASELVVGSNSIKNVSPLRAHFCIDFISRECRLDRKKTPRRQEKEG